MRFLRSLFSRSYRQARHLYEHVLKIYQHQRDILPEKNQLEMRSALAEMDDALRERRTKPELEAAMTRFEERANKWLQPYPHASLRENLDMVLVAGAVAIGIRTFFFQPMEIPTGSAQPTFYGITHTDLRGRPEVKIPGGLERFYLRWIKGTRYFEVIAKADGPVDLIEPTALIKLGPLRLFKQLKFRAGGVWYRVGAPADNPEAHLGLREIDERGFLRQRFFRTGEPIIRCEVRAGDKLFVNRVTYNFRQPRRGETIVFRSENHPGMTSNTHYIKRLVGLGGELMRIGNDRHAYINDRRLGTNDPGFEKVYSFDPNQPPRDSHYSGHVNGTLWTQLGRDPSNCRNFPNEKAVVAVRPQHYVTFGDNTMNSADSRAWPVPDFPQERVIGKSGFVFWPFTSRWGWKQK